VELQLPTIVSLVIMLVIMLVLLPLGLDALDAYLENRQSKLGALTEVVVPESARTETVASVEAVEEVVAEEVAMTRPPPEDPRNDPYATQGGAYATLEHVLMRLGLLTETPPRRRPPPRPVRAPPLAPRPGRRRVPCSPSSA